MRVPILKQAFWCLEVGPQAAARRLLAAEASILACTGVDKCHLPLIYSFCDPACSCDPGEGLAARSDLRIQRCTTQPRSSGAIVSCSALHRLQGSREQGRSWKTFRASICCARGACVGNSFADWARALVEPSCHEAQESGSRKASCHSCFASCSCHVLKPTR